MVCPVALLLINVNNNSCGPPRGYEPARQLSCAQVGEQMGPAAYRRANTRAPPTPAPGAAPAIHTRCKEDASAYGSCCSRWAHGDDEDLFALEQLYFRQTEITVTDILVK